MRRLDRAILTKKSKKTRFERKKPCLEQIHKGKRATPPRILLYGTEGIGKSTFAAQAPSPIFIPTEDGLGEIDCASFPLAKKYTDVEAYLSALAIEQHEYQTVIVDSCDWLEQLIWDDLCHTSHASSIEKCDGGYGRGYVAAIGYWRQIARPHSKYCVHSGIWPSF